MLGYKMKKFTGQIETSVGIIDVTWLDGEHRPHSPSISEGHSQLLYKLYRHCGPGVIIVVNGSLWLTIDLNDPHYGSPEYKIFNIREVE